MIIGRVIGRLVSTRKHEKLVGNKFLICEIFTGQGGSQKIVAIDTVGAGMDEVVMITTGSAARLTSFNTDAPVDAAIIGIIDDENNLGVYQ